jgi:Cu(I)/Ag(I) efflux system protein CusF
MKNINTVSIAVAIAASLSMSVIAQDKAAPVQAVTTVAKTPEMADGEIRKIDRESKKITIKHGEIKNLEMPGMTMVFQVKDPAMLDKVKVGDKVKFSAEQLNGAIVVTDIQSSK